LVMLTVKAVGVEGVGGLATVLLGDFEEVVVG